MRIGMLSAWASHLGGGVFEAVVAHAAMLRDMGHAPHVFALADAHSDADRARFGAIPVVTCPAMPPRRLGHAPGLLPAMLAADLDLVHLHGIWTAPSLAGARWAAHTGRGYVVSPHGMLDPWITARGRVQKTVVRHLYERRSWARATRFHALTGAEAADIVRETGRPAGVVDIVPNPVETPLRERDADDGGAPFALALGRIHPKKNLLALVDGWIASQAPKQGWSLVIAGWGEAGHVADLERRLAKGDAPGVRFVGKTFGADKARLLRDALFLALPSHSEGLPMAVLEAWAAGTPTIQSEGCNLPEGVAAGAAILTGTGVADISAAIDRAVAAGPAGLRAMGDAASTLARGRFSPQVVQAQWDHIYEEIAR